LTVRTELTDIENALLASARKAGLCAYAPYSNFRVGAAVRTDVGVFVGCNVENSSYGLCVCAERIAIFSAVSAGAKRIDMVAVTCLDAAGESEVGGRMPCGACRQVIAEFAGAAVSVIVDGAGVWSLSELLPQPFVLR
jgi:cytidine deaminase